MQTHHIHTSSPDAIEEENNLPTPEVLQVNILVPPPLNITIDNSQYII